MRLEEDFADLDQARAWLERYGLFVEDRTDLDGARYLAALRRPPAAGEDASAAAANLVGGALQVDDRAILGLRARAWLAVTSATADLVGRMVVDELAEAADIEADED